MPPDIAEDIRARIRGQMPAVIANLRAKAGEHVLDRPRREAGYTIQNAAGDEAVVRIYDEIWWLGVNALDLAADLDTITAPAIRVEINSPGGDVFDGIAIYNALRQHPATVTTRVDGLAASIASVIAQAGDKRIMVTGSQMMIHNAWGMTVGDQAEHEQMAKVLDVQDEVIAAIYASKSTNDADHFRGLMNSETWMTAERAVEEGLADEILDPEASEEEPKAKLIDKISLAVGAVKDAISSAEQVGADRAEAGKGLTTVTLDGLGGLRDSIVALDGLLHIPAPPMDPHVADAKYNLAKRTAAFRAALPPHLL